MMIMADVPRRKASRLLRCNEKTLASILSYWVTQAVEALDLSDVGHVGVSRLAEASLALCALLIKDVGFVSMGAHGLAVL